MTTDTHQRAGVGYASGPVTKAPNWHGLVAWDMLFNNLTTGLFLAAALGELIVPDAFRRVATFAYPLALVLLITDLACLVLDLGDPLRFHHMLRVFKPSSPMSLGTWSLTIYSLPLTVLTALSVLPIEGPTVDWVRKVLLIFGIFPALGSAVYKGVLLSTSSQPGWKDGRWLGGYLANSALMLGSAELLVLAVLLGQDRAGAILRVAVLVLLVLNVIVLLLLAAELRPTLVRVYSLEYLVRLAVLDVGGGTLVPLGLLLAGGSTAFVVAVVLCMVLGSLAIRYAIIGIPHAMIR